MRTMIGLMSAIGLLLAATLAPAQGPGRGPGRNLSKSADVDDLVTRMMAFDKDKDGKLTKDEVTDARLRRLFDRADADKDAVVIKDELTALGNREHVEGRGGFGGGPGGPPPGGFGGPGGPMFGPPRPGEVLPAMLQQRLQLSAKQKSQVAELQKEVDAKLAKILTEEQRAQLEEMRQRGPGGFGPPGGPGGPPPPGGPGDGPPPPGGPPGA
jgi:hypothetical protein